MLTFLVETAALEEVVAEREAAKGGPPPHDQTARCSLDEEAVLLYYCMKYNSV